MSIQELVDQLFADLPPQNVGEFGLLVKDKILHGYSTDQQKIILEQLEAVGIIVNGIPCKRIPT
ncbi:MAG: hypothetical protein WC998_06415 [Candidatus Paceibacterota bacterium]